MSDIELNNNLFSQAVETVLTENPQIEEIIETGTHRGTGSTVVWAMTGLPVKTIEVQRVFHEEAKRNLQNFSNVELYLGSILPYTKMEKFIRESEDYYSSAYKKNIGCEIDIYGSAVNFYINEINGGGFAGGSQHFFEGRPESENLLPDLINNEKNQLIFLDSAGGVGFLEYLEVMSMRQEYLTKKILFLDDTNHVKHHRSVEDLEKRGYTVTETGDGRSAYCNFIQHHDETR